MRKIKFFVCACTLVTACFFANAEVKAASGSFSFSGGEIIEEEITPSSYSIMALEESESESTLLSKSSTSVSVSTGFSGGMSLSGGVFVEDKIEESPKSDEKESVEEAPVKEPSNTENTVKEEPSVKEPSNTENTVKEEPSVKEPSNTENTVKEESSVKEPSNTENTVVKEESSSTNSGIEIAKEDSPEETLVASNDTTSDETLDTTEQVVSETVSSFQAENQPVVALSDDSVALEPYSMSTSSSNDKQSGESKSNSSLIKLLPSKDVSSLLPSTKVEDKTEFPEVRIGLLSLFLLLMLVLFAMRYRVVDEDDNTDIYTTLKKAVLSANGKEGYKVLDYFKKPSERCVCEIKAGQVVIPEYVNGKSRERILKYVQNK